MTFDADETGIETSQPRDLYELILPTITYRLTSGVKDIVHSGLTYKATTLSRGNTRSSTTDGTPGEMEIPLLVTHALPQRYLRGGIPPRRIDVNVYRKQLTSGEVELAWAGVVVGMSCERHIAKLLVAQRMSDAIPRRIPTISVGRECAHVLYDSNCAIDRSLFKVATTVSATTTLLDQSGRTITVASMGGKPDQWAKFGELLHVASGERMSIQDQTGTKIRIQLPIMDILIGDAVEVYAGCDHSIATCLSKFNNRDNFGGFPKLPKRNPFVANGYGISEQE